MRQHEDALERIRDSGWGNNNKGIQYQKGDK